MIVDDLTFELIDPIASIDTNGTPTYALGPLGTALSSPTDSTRALSFALKKSLNPRAVIKSCEFRNLNRDIELRGSLSCLIENNRFLAQHGNLSIRGTGAGGLPNVGIWSFINASGLAGGLIEGVTENTQVIGNYFNGYVDLPEDDVQYTPSAKDGFVFGHSAGWLIADNVVKNFTFEGIIFPGSIGDVISSLSPSEQQRFLSIPTIIFGNKVEQDWPINGGWGIRCDIGNVLIANNIIQMNAAYGSSGIIRNPSGIFTRLLEAAEKSENPKIIANYVYFPLGGEGITVTASKGHVTVKDNTVLFETLLEDSGSGFTQYGIHAAYVPSGTIANNSIILLESLTNIVASAGVGSIADLHSVGIIDQQNSYIMRTI
ncbi:MAG: hypothetical protein GKR87_07300 [Kiritimatiellae bacterium]|nr:hypothetical protein [Kiritimatiellia bacterium]